MKTTDPAFHIIHAPPAYMRRHGWSLHASTPYTVEACETFEELRFEEPATPLAVSYHEGTFWVWFKG